ncbi:MAG: 6-pyruvoyl-tetrahydropterin synthase-related protein [Chloroflexota bacterium]|nr:6-pyruvoyl-tetrahydropterin synthase-related protein [Chloroflexota bacterium]
MHSRSVVWGNVVPLAALLFVVLIAAGPLWGPGLLNTRGGGDSPFLLLRTHQLAVNLQTGVFPVRWMPDAAYGLGYPFFSYYAALPYYLAAGFTLVGLDILSAIKLTQTLFFAAAALGIYGWARRVLHSQPGGWLAAVAYTLAPFHMVNVYVRGDSLSEFAAFAFYPLILWGLDHLAARPSLRRTLPSALAYAGLILTHNGSALIFSPFMLLYIVVISCAAEKEHEAENRKQKAGEKRRFVICRCSLLIVPLLIGILLSAWFWLPALAETGHVQLTAQTSGYFFYGNHFRGPDLVQPRLIFDYAITPSGPTPFAMGLVQATLALAGVLVIIVEWARSRLTVRRSPFAIRHSLFVILGLALSTWLITPLSRPLWDHLPLLPMVQFPWRLLSVQALFAALLGGVLVTYLRRSGWAVATALAILLGVVSLAGLHPEYLTITAEEITIERLQLYELFTGNVGSTIRHEYLPHWVVPRPYTGPTLFNPHAPPQAILLSGELVSAEETTHKATRRVWMVETGPGGAEVAFPLYYWPGWRAMVDGAPAEAKPAPDSGYLTLAVPAGRHTVVMWLGRTPLRAVAEGVSLVTALVLLVVAITSRRETQNPKSQTLNWPLITCHLSFVISLALLLTFNPRVALTNGDDLTMDFERMPYLHHNPGGVDFDRWQMAGYRYSTDRLAPGDTLDVTLDWNAWQGENSVTLRLVSPAVIRQDELSAVATVTAQLQPDTPSPTIPWPGSTALELPIPQEAAPGLYLVHLEGGGEKVKTAYLRPVWVSAGETSTGQPAGSMFAEGALHLHAVEATQVAPDRLDLRLDWSAAKSIAANYGLRLRLTDPAGNEWTRLDTQPGYGFLPTSLWPVGRIVHDRYTLLLPTGIPPGDDYTLTVNLYRVTTWESVGEFISSISLDRATLRPDARTIAHFGDELALNRLKVPERVQQGETLPLTACWLAIEQPSADYMAEWRLEMAETSRFVIHDSLFTPLAPGSPPATWPAGAWVVGRAVLPIPPTAPPGNYTLSLTLHNPTSGASLGTYTHSEPVRVQERERVWELPPMQHETSIRFGEVIELAGYDLKQDRDTLHLTLHWRALTIPDQHYMLFVHLADQITGQPVTQVDTMPRGFTYPTGLWAPEEIVSDEVVLSLEGVPGGQYDLAIGWYEPETKIRLEAQDVTGSVLPNNRLVLSELVTIP